MVCQQRCQLTIKPEYGYKHKDCHMTPPKGVSIGEPMHVDIKLLEIYSKDDVRVVGTNENIYKTIKQRSESWESPREPYEVEVSCSARVPAPSGQQGDSTPYFVAPSLKFTMGSGTAPSEWKWLGSNHRYRYVMEVRDMTGNGEVVKRRIKEGTGQFPMDCPMADSRLQIHYRGYVINTGQEFVNTRGADSNAQPLEFDSGMGILPEAIDMTVRLMTPGEVSLITSTSQYAYDGRPDRPPGMPEGAKVEWEVELISFQKQPDWERAEPDAKIKHAGELKDQGNIAFKAGRLKPARSKYTKALRLADRIFDLETEEQAEAASFVKTACLVNLANCAHREQHFGEALDWESHNHAKALYRRAMAFAALGELDKAQQDFIKWKEVDPSATADADAQIAKLKLQQKAANAKQKQQFRNFFDRT
ncbi:MAG: peptidyl-prolyl isomerase PASTICCINO1 [Trebouxia sp. A1-2]|nr:MAG: peptidyl-prolyl isomerase PASTICCINO1 [Trebouxia sp. A1-2]